MFNDFPGDDGFWQEPDPFLADLVSNFVNKGGMELGITLFLKGMVVTGTLVAEADYLRAISDLFAGQARRSLIRPTPDEIKATEEVFNFSYLTEDVPPLPLAEANGADGFGDDDDEDEDDFDEYDMDDAPVPIIRHLHLKDPVILQPESSISFAHSQVSIIRIRLNAVDGWMIGKVSVEDDDNFMTPPGEIRH